MIFRKFNDKDSEQLLLILSQVWSIDSIQKDVLSSFLENDNHLYVIEKDGNVIACATLHLQKKLIRNGGIAGFIEEVAVREDYRGKGIGEILIRELVKIAEELNCYKVVLSCYPERIDFYTRCGFEKETTNMRINIK
jgi:glucosamine-phosphate N-acetyltransferase